MNKILFPFAWHHHDNENELFYVVKETLIGSFGIVPRGVEHPSNAKRRNACCFV